MTDVDEGGGAGEQGSGGAGFELWVAGMGVDLNDGVATPRRGIE